jgi:hypothetical protein
VWDLVRREQKIGSLNVTPYLLGGVGYSFLNIDRSYPAGSTFSSGLDVDLAHPLPKSIPVVLAGGGIRHAITPAIAVIAEAAYRIATFTDYVDGFSQAGNPDRDDHYYTVSIGLIYSFQHRKGARGHGVVCPAYQ